MMKHIIVCLLVVTSISCKEKGTDKDLINIKIDPTDIYNSSFEYFIDSVIFIPLETTSGNALGTIQKVDADENHYYVLDYSGHQPVQVYSRSGKFNHFIGTKGRGPEEFNMLKDFIIDKDGNIGLLESRSLKKFSLSGQFISSLEIDVVTDRIYPLKDKKYIHYIGNGVTVDNTSDRFFLTDEQMKPLSYFLKKERYYDKFAMETTIFCPVDESIRLFHEMGEMIYTYNEASNKVVPTYKLDFGKYWPDKDFLKASYHDDPVTFFNKRVSRGYISFPLFRESKDFVCLSYVINANTAFSEYYVTIFSKENLRSYTFKVGDKDPVTLLFSRMLYHDNNWFLSEISPMNLKKVARYYTSNTNNKPYWVQHLIDLSEKLDDFDNPVLVSIKINQP